MNFDTKIVVVVRADLLMWQKLNVTAFTVSGIAGLPDVLGEHYVDGSDTSYLPMIKQPITAAEERGLKGARSFLTWAKEHDLTLAEVMNLDMLGRDRLAVRPSALPGFYFWLPLLGKFSAIANPVRRRILELLRNRSLAAGEIASEFDLNRPAVSEHLQVLKSVNLVQEEARGRQRFYHLNATAAVPTSSSLS